MGAWNRYAIEHVLDLFETNSRYPGHKDITLSVLVARGRIPFKLALASGLQIFIDQYGGLGTGIAEAWKKHKSCPELYPYPFPYQVVVKEDSYGYIRSMQRAQVPDITFPSMGIYIYYHPFEKYKIGQAENVQRRMETHWCAAPSAQLLHVVETRDLGWCETFLHHRFGGKRRHRNHEYFNLERFDLMWLFGIDILNRPKTPSEQRSFLELL